MRKRKRLAGCIYLMLLLIALSIFCSSCQSPVISSPVVETKTLTDSSPAPSVTLTPTASPSESQTTTSSEIISSDPMIKMTLNNIAISIALSPDGRWLAIGTFLDDSTFTVWIKDMVEPISSEWIELFTDATPLLDAPNVKFSPDGKNLAIVTTNEIWFYNTGDWKHRQRFAAETYMRFYNWSPDNQGIAVAIQSNGNILYYLKMDGTKVPLLKYTDVFPEGEPELDPTAKVYSDMDFFHWGPSWSPDGKKLAYVTYRESGVELWTLEIASGKKEMLASGIKGYKPIWSPDGKKIALIGAEILVFDVENKTLTSYLTGNFILTLDYIWSPDSSRLALHTHPMNGDGGVYSVNVQTGETQLMQSGTWDIYAWTYDNEILLYDIMESEFELAPLVNGVAITPTPFPATSTPGVLSGPAPTKIVPYSAVSSQAVTIEAPELSLFTVLSPDRQWIALPQWIGTNVYVGDIRNPANPVWTKILPEDQTGSEEYQTEFSPDGKWLAAVSYSDVWFFQTGDWQNPKHYSYRLWSDYFAWSPDSQGISIQIKENGNIVSYLTIEGSLTPLLQWGDVFPESDSARPSLDNNRSGPTWSPDGKQLAYMSIHDGYNELWVLTIATGEKEMLYRGVIGVSPLWSPDGKKIALNNGDIEIYNLETKILSTFYSDGDSNGGPVSLGNTFFWSPDSSQIASQYDDAVHRGIYVFSIASEERHVVVPGVTDIYSWTRDGYMLVLYPDTGEILEIIPLEKNQ